LTWVGLTVVLTLGALVLPMLPTWAEAPPRPGEAEYRPAPKTIPPERVAPPAAPGSAGVREGTPDSVQGRVIISPPDHVVVVPVGEAEGAVSPQEARDAVDLLRLRVREKEAELREAKALLDQGQHQLDRTEKLHQKGATDEGTLEQAHSQVEVLQSRLLGKEAQLQEAQLLLKQAERRLARHHGTSPDADLNRIRPPSSAPPAPPAPPANQFAAPGMARGRASSNERLLDLEKKLDALAQEVEVLKRELEKHPPVIPVPSYRVVPTPPPAQREDPRDTPTVPLTPQPNPLAR
ncbi:MAG: hypothetical protein JO112_06910, partial [Planctomycetes bacterium]|nr:hypothetical protein [Planctomycetota bacterium]